MNILSSCGKLGEHLRKTTESTDLGGLSRVAPLGSEVGFLALAMGTSSWSRVPRPLVSLVGRRILDELNEGCVFELFNIKNNTQKTL